MNRMFICGIEVFPLTVGAFAQHVVAKSPFLLDTGEPVNAKHIVSFLWRQSVEYCPGDEQRLSAFVARVCALPAQEAIDGIAAYVCRQFEAFDQDPLKLNTPEGKAIMERVRLIVESWGERALVDIDIRDMTIFALMQRARKECENT